MTSSSSRLVAIAAAVFLASCRSIPSDVPPEYSSPLEASAYMAATAIIQSCSLSTTPCEMQPGTAMSGINIDAAARTVEIEFNEYLAYRPLRPDGVRHIYSIVSQFLDPDRYDIAVTSGGYEISELVPNLYRQAEMAVDASRKPTASTTPQIVRPASGERYPAGLSGRHIALWPSHGWYYEHRLNRWEWQRARLFETVEDLYPFSYVIPYVAPMLEKAGASVFMPRERDTQSNEVVVDNDSTMSGRALSDSLKWSSSAPGFAIGNPPYNKDDRPFTAGTHEYTIASPVATDSIQWVPDIPATGDYAVYISYASYTRSITDAHYTVRYSGGEQSFFVNQRIGGGTWIYLGTFHFKAGSNSDQGAVSLTNESGEAGVVTADAVRFGGGMGNIIRNGQTSGRPRFTEGARYFMQYAGMPDSLVFDVTDGDDNDYVDDYRGRGEWANFLRGNPYGPNKDRTQGLGIPIDLSLAFHTDAGVTRRDTTIGTLLIYSTPGADTTGHFPDGISRLANRDFSDILQTEIVSDIRSTYDSTWTRRAMWDKDYSEAHRPNIPSALLELLSHQNFEDMKYGLDPGFRFHTSRSIYKAILKYLSNAYGYDYVVQPLPVDHVAARLNGTAGVDITWRSVDDPLEPSAIPQKYRVYTAIDGGGFDSGFITTTNATTIDNLEPGRAYAFRVAGINDGGEGFPSETIAVGVAPAGAPPVLIVNGFDRVAAPASVDSDEITGFLSFLDEGVPDGIDMSYVGAQYDYRFSNPWSDDDAPGHGASYADQETKLIAGNTFNFSILHGNALLAAGHSFVTASDEAVESGSVNLSDYPVIDYLLGEERSSDPPGARTAIRFEAFSPGMQMQLANYLSGGGNLFVSGAYVGTDLFAGQESDAAGPTFGREILGMSWRTNQAARTGQVVTVDVHGVPTDSLRYNSEFSSKMYKVEAPDAIEPSDGRGRTFMRYTENNTGAGVVFDSGNYRVVSLGFPLETILDEQDRNRLMSQVLEYLLSGSDSSR